MQKIITGFLLLTLSQDLPTKLMFVMESRLLSTHNTYNRYKLYKHFVHFGINYTNFKVSSTLLKTIEECAGLMVNSANTVNINNDAL